MNLEQLKAHAEQHKIYWNLDLAFPSVDCPVCSMDTEELPHTCSHCGADRRPETMRLYADMMAADMVKEFLSDLEGLLKLHDVFALHCAISNLRASWT